MSESREGQRFYGKFRGKVINNIDPLNRGRLMVEVPDVLGPGVPSSWAEASIPLAGNGSPMGAFFLPPVQSGVWVEFENGEPDHPIWTGCRWGMASDLPSIARAGLPASPSIVLQTMGQNYLAIADGPAGGITLRTATGAMIMITEAGITITNGKGATIQLTGPNVTINNGSLMVM